jgi:hypothetical protein
MTSNTYTYIATCTVAGVATTVSSSACTLKRIVMNVSTNVVVGIIDNTSGTTINVGKIYKNPVQNVFNYDLRCGAGLIITTTGATTIKPDITVVWNQ